MYKRYPHDIKNYLQNEDVKERVQHNMERGHEEATVTIGRAARLFSFTENKLRDWESLGLLKPLRSKDITGQRQYSPEELDKLAIIKELIEGGGFTPGEIPSDIDKIWSSILDEQHEKILKLSGEETEHLHLDQRIDTADEALFWRYYSSHVLRLSLMLICKDIPDTIARLVLPLPKPITPASIPHPAVFPTPPL